MGFRELSVRCIVCEDRAEMRPIDQNPLVVCPQCQSVWMHETDFFVLLRKYQPTVEVQELVEHNYGENRRGCPDCDEPMNIVWLVDLALARCEKHGVWFDPGELARALAWDVKDDEKLIGYMQYNTKPEKDPFRKR